MSPDLPLWSCSPAKRRKREIDFAFEQDVRNLTPIAEELFKIAEQRGEKGITGASVLRIGQARGILLASQQQRYLARLSRAVVKAAGLHPVGKTRTPRIKKQGGNDVLLYGRAA